MTNNEEILNAILQRLEIIEAKVDSMNEDCGDDALMITLGIATVMSQLGIDPENILLAVQGGGCVGFNDGKLVWTPHEGEEGCDQISDLPIALSLINNINGGKDANDE